MSDDEFIAEGSATQRQLCALATKMLNRLTIISRNIDTMSASDIDAFADIVGTVYSVSINAAIYDKRVELELAREEPE